jgi:Flp pilus assembly protein TadD
VVTKPSAIASLFALLTLVPTSAAARKDPFIDAFIDLNAGRYTLAELAEEVLRRAVTLEPDSAQARYALGSTLLRLGRTDEAKAQLDEFQRLQAAALEKQRHTFELELRTREADLRAPEAGR